MMSLRETGNLIDRGFQLLPKPVRQLSGYLGIFADDCTDVFDDSGVKN